MRADISSLRSICRKCPVFSNIYNFLISAFFNKEDGKVNSREIAYMLRALKFYGFMVVRIGFTVVNKSAYHRHLKSSFGNIGTRQAIEGAEKRIQDFDIRYIQVKNLINDFAKTKNIGSSTPAIN